jgi:hypothetical protein
MIKNSVKKAQVVTLKGKQQKKAVVKSIVKGIVNLDNGRSKSSLIFDLPLKELPLNKKIVVANLSTFKEAIKSGRAGNFTYIGSTSRSAIVTRLQGKVKVVKGELLPNNPNLCKDFTLVKK